ncbi:1700016H13Rik [Phodopus roborovskii]|uniref:1700016H13Rik protein n=1 Tax=Phodopus roborovskii TaxID=109678 RepID=A0AAU9ZWJ1_PHORO|nr:1700016H13Rik [Phodopus roborovskii]
MGLKEYGLQIRDKQEPWDLAQLTKTWYTNLTNIRLPFLGEIAFGSPIKLATCKTIKGGLLPSAQSIKVENECEMKRLTKLKCQEKAREEIQVALRQQRIGLRRPLQPK